MKQRGFTLVELLVVISIIALLMAILIPGLSMCRELARRVLCGNTLKTIGQANISYVNAWNGYYIPFGFPEPSVTKPGRINVRQWLNNRDFRKYIQLQSYAKGDEIQNLDGTVGDFTLTKEFECPSDRSVRLKENALSGLVLVSYGCNITDWGGRGDFSALWQVLIGYKQDQVKNPSEKLMYTEGVGDWWLSWNGADYSIAWDIFRFAPNRTYRDRVPGGRGFGAVAYRHNEGANVLFYDTHVEYMKKQKMYDSKDWNTFPTRRYGMWAAVPPSR